LATASFNRSVSLDTPFSMDEDAGSLVDIIPNENAESTDSSLIKDGISKELEVVLSKLSYRERDVLRMSYGLGMQAMQHEEIASRFGIGCERVRQIQHEAIKKIRDRYSDLLKELL
jgi:RNA polymerase primary sigma factor